MEASLYRPNAGIIIFNRQGKLLWCKRKTGDGWQFPQGGIDDGESPEQAIIRETYEEVGLKHEKIKIIRENDRWINYDVPLNLANKLWNGQFRGQTQKWVLFNFTGDDNEININTEYPEFNEWQWTSPLDLTNKAIYFKKDVYEKINLIFLPIIKDFIN